MIEATALPASPVARSTLYVVAFRTIVIKEVNRFLRIWLQTILPPAITMGLYFVIFGNLIGPRIGLMSGFDYMQYIAPGIIMMAIITNAYSNVVSSFFGAKFQRHIEEILVAPVPDALILGGYVCGGIIRGIIVGALVTVVALFFTDLHVNSYPITIAVVILTSALFSLAGFINAILAKKFDDISIVPSFVLTPLTYLGGVFYSIDLLPVLAPDVASEPDPVYGQRLPLRHTRDQRYRSGSSVCRDPGFCRSAFGDQSAAIAPRRWPARLTHCSS